jgi:NTP pyrophosphatase (non-canonical NTP hydrolase)
MNTPKTLNELAQEIYQNAVDHGFYDAEINLVDSIDDADTEPRQSLKQMAFSQRIALIHSELSEALEADRKNRYAYNVGVIAKMDSTTEEYMEAFRNNIKDTVEDELADALIRILDTCAAHRIDIDTHIRLKMAYNKQRPRLHGKSY